MFVLDARSKQFAVVKSEHPIPFHAAFVPVRIVSRFGVPEV